MTIDDLLNSKHIHGFFAIRQQRLYFTKELPPDLAWRLFGITALINHRIATAMAQYLEDSEHEIPS